MRERWRKLLDYLMSYEKDKLDSYVTSASLSTALAQYVTSNSLSAAIAGLDLAPYMTSNSISAGVVTDALTVRGPAAVSATLSAAAVTVAGRPIGCVLLEHQTFGGTTSYSFSGSWSDFAVLQFHAHYRVESGTAARGNFKIYNDGGTTEFLALGDISLTLSTGQITAVECKMYGGDNSSLKTFLFEATKQFGVNTQVYDAMTSTLTAGFVNCIRFTSSATMTLGMAVLYGWRKA
jgi:hypothetical protein